MSLHTIFVCRAAGSAHASLQVALCHNSGHPSSSRAENQQSPKLNLEAAWLVVSKHLHHKSVSICRREEEETSVSKQVNTGSLQSVLRHPLVIAMRFKLCMIVGFCFKGTLREISLRVP